MLTTISTVSPDLIAGDNVFRGVRLQWPGRTIPAGLPAKLDGARVDVDETAGRRSYRDRIGAINRVRMQDGVLRADFAVNAKHELAPQVAWDATNAPSTLALKVITRRDGGYSVVLVAVGEAGSGQGLFEDSDSTNQAAELLRQDTFQEGDFIMPTIIESELAAMRTARKQGTLPEYLQRLGRKIGQPAITPAVAATPDLQESLEDHHRRLSGRVRGDETAAEFRRRHATAPKARAIAFQESTDAQPAAAPEALTEFRRRHLCRA
jgi:hypothetical protein